jgi:hypothetical protein
MVQVAKLRWYWTRKRIVPYVKLYQSGHSSNLSANGPREFVIIEKIVTINDSYLVYLTSFLAS